MQNEQMFIVLNLLEVLGSFAVSSLTVTLTHHQRKKKKKKKKKMSHVVQDEEAFLLQVQKERDDLLHQMEVLERQIDELCARDDFEKAELLDVELQTLQHRLELVLAMVPPEEEENEDENEEESDLTLLKVWMEEKKDFFFFFFFFFFFNFNVV